MNIDDVRTIVKYNKITQRMKDQQIGLARIQETHNTEHTTYAGNGYEIISSNAISDNIGGKGKNITKGKGGVSIYSANLGNTIYNISRISNRIITIKLKTEIDGCKVK